MTQPDSPRPARLRFGRDRRIQKRAEFKAIYDTGRRLRGRFVVVFCRARPAGPAGEKLPWRIGLTATRKTGGSVQRNRQRRRLREYFRVNQGRIPEGWDFVINTTARLNEASAPDLAADLDRTLAPLGIKPRPEAAPPDCPQAPPGRSRSGG